MNYSSELMIRDDIVDGEANWMWVSSDVGAWGGPVQDWITSHRDKYFKYLTDKTFVVTAGGNCGLYTRQYAKHFKVVYAFEPDPLNFHCMVNNSQSHNVVKMQCALGAENKMIAMNTTERTNVGVYTVVDDMEGCYIPMMTLDSMNLPGCNLLQLDVEGYEFKALSGAEKTIKKYRPIIVIETVEGSTLELMKKLKYSKIDESCMDHIFAHKDHVYPE